MQGSRPMMIRFAKLVVELAKREFPLAWPTMLSDLRCHFDAQSENLFGPNTFVCLYILTILFEDLTESNDFHSKISAQRRDEIIVGLQEQLPSVVSFIYEWLGVVLLNMSEMRSTGENDMKEWNEIVVSSLRLLVPLMSVSSADLLCSQYSSLDSELGVTNGHDFSMLALQLLDTPLFETNDLTQTIPFAALQFISALAQTKMSKDNFWTIVEHFPSGKVHVKLICSLQQSFFHLPGASMLLSSLNVSWSNDNLHIYQFYNLLGATLGETLV